MELKTHQEHYGTFNLTQFFSLHQMTISLQKYIQIILYENISMTYKVASHLVEPI